MQYLPVTSDLAFARQIKSLVAETRWSKGFSFVSFIEKSVETIMMLDHQYRLLHDQSQVLWYYVGGW